MKHYKTANRYKFLAYFVIRQASQFCLCISLIKMGTSVKFFWGNNKVRKALKGGDCAFTQDMEK